MRYWQNLRRDRAETGSVTLNMLVEFLETFDYHVIRKPRINKSVRGLSFSQDTRGFFVPREGNAGTLYIIESIDSAAEIEFPSQASSYIVLLKSQEAEKLLNDLSPQQQHYLDCSIVISLTDPHTSVAQIENDIFNYIVSIDRFISCLAMASGSPREYQGLVDVAENFFNCFIAITDANNMLVAHTKHIAPKDPVNLSLIHLKYHDEQFLSQEQSKGYLSDKIASQEGVVVYPPKYPFPYSLVTAPLKSGGSFAGYVVMACNETDITPGTLDSFSLFLMYLEKATRRKSDALSGGNTHSQNLLLSLISKKDIDPIFIEQQARRLEMPLSASFILVRAKWDIEHSTQISYFADEINRANTSHIAVRLKDSLLVLVHGRDPELALSGLDSLICSYPISTSRRIYLSDPFTKLNELYFAFRQITNIEKYDKVIDLHRSWSSDEERYLVSFKDAFCFYWNDPFKDEEIQDYTIAHMITNLIAENDRIKQTDDMSLLLAYLANERKAGTISDRYHLHRNGVLYRIRRIQKQYRLNLDDYLTREYLQSCIRVKLALEGNAPSVLTHYLDPTSLPSEDVLDAEEQEGEI